jgi:hypothetical protein
VRLGGRIKKGGRLMLKTLSRAFVLSLAIASIALAQPAAAGGRSATETITINNQVTLISPTTVLVVVSFSCTPYGFGGSTPGVDATGFVSAQVFQTDLPASGFGSSGAVPCDGHARDVQIVVTGGPFHLGLAQVTASGCNFDCDTDSRQARVVSP